MTISNLHSKLVEVIGINRICECSTTVSIQVFQTWDESSILSTRTKHKKRRKSIYTLYFYICIYEKDCGIKLPAQALIVFWKVFFVLGNYGSIRKNVIYKN